MAYSDSNEIYLAELPGNKKAWFQHSEINADIWQMIEPLGLATLTEGLAGKPSKPLRPHKSNQSLEP